MKNIVAINENIEFLIGFLSNLVKGLGFLEAPPGLGKTTAALWYVDQQAQKTSPDRKPVFIRVLASDTPRTFLRRLSVELGFPPKFSLSDNHLQIEEHFIHFPRLLLIDEVDRLASNYRFVEIVRDLADVAAMPVLMIGMPESKAQLVQFPQFHYRMRGNFISFNPLTLEDTRRFADQACEVRLDDAALKEIHDGTGGIIGEIIPELVKAEKLARHNDLSVVKAGHLRSVT